MSERISDDEYKAALHAAAVKRSGIGADHGSQEIGEGIDCVAFTQAKAMSIGKGWGEIMPIPSTCFHPEIRGSCVLLTPDGSRIQGATCDWHTPWNSPTAEKLKAAIYESLKD